MSCFAFGSQRVLCSYFSCESWLRCSLVCTTSTGSVSGLLIASASSHPLGFFVIYCEFIDMLLQLSALTQSRSFFLQRRRRCGKNRGKVLIVPPLRRRSSARWSTMGRDVRAHRDVTLECVLFIASFCRVIAPNS